MTTKIGNSRQNDRFLRLRLPARPAMPCPPARDPAGSEPADAASEAFPPSGDPVIRLFDDVLSGIGLQNDQTYYIKRVIGLPGDHVACCTNGKVTVNGVPLSESSYLFPGNVPSSFKFSEVVPPGHLWVMGDHRSDSDDSRYHPGDPGGGAIPENQVVGRAFLIIWPLSQIRDLPIPSTFQQAALHAGAAVAAVPVAGAAGAAGVIGAPLLLLRRRRSQRRDEGKTGA